MSQTDISATEFAASWHTAATAVAPGVHAIAERGVEKAYRAAGLAPPQRIVWCRSPMEIERQRRATWYSATPGPAVRLQVVDNVIHCVQAAAQQTVPQTLLREAAQAFAPRFAPLQRAARSIDEVVQGEINSRRWPLTFWAAPLVGRLTKALQPLPHFSYAAWGQIEGREILGIHKFLLDKLPAFTQAAPLEGLWDLALNCGWAVLHERVCWLSERCTALALDPLGRLHSSSGPALGFADGWTRYAWKGVTIPSWFVEQSDRVTPYQIARMNDPVWRRCMIEIMTPERFIESGAAKCVASDATGRLWRAEWGLDAWSAVEVVNGTAEPDGTFKHYFLQVPSEMRSPLAAVAWTYGISTDRYAQLAKRT